MHEWSNHDGKDKIRTEPHDQDLGIVMRRGINTGEDDRRKQAISTSATPPLRITAMAVSDYREDSCLGRPCAFSDKARCLSTITLPIASPAITLQAARPAITLQAARP